MEPSGRPRHVLRAELLSIGSEITAGETRDTNAGELARALTEAGVRVVRLGAVPDDLDAVREAFATALTRADLVVSTGGLGPTPDDLTREAVAGLCGESPTVDPELERWLRALWARRGMAFPDMNLKQAWLIPSARPISNRNGTAPGWWVELPDGRLIVTLPGPPREMRAMWAETIMPALRERGLGRPQVVRTYRLAGIGESQVADLLGEPLLRAANPVVATYARADAVDVRISAVPEPDTDGRHGRSADELVDEAEAIVLATLGGYVWGRGGQTWPEAIGERLDHLGWTLATSERGTGGTLATLLGGAPWLRLAESLVADSTDASEPPPPPPTAATPTEGDGAEPPDETVASELERIAAALRERTGTDVALALRVRSRGDDTAVEIAVASPRGLHRERRLAFLGGAQGRSRAALLAAAVLLERLRLEAREEDLAGR